MDWRTERSLFQMLSCSSSTSTCLLLSLSWSSQAGTSMDINKHQRHHLCYWAVAALKSITLLHITSYYHWTISINVLLDDIFTSYCTVLYHILYSFITYHIVSYCIAWQQAVLHHIVYFLLTFPHCGTNKGIFHYILFSSIASYPLSPNIFFSVQVQLFGTVNFKL